MTIITAAEIQKGDLIRVTRTEQFDDRKDTTIYEGVAAVREADYKGKVIWRTQTRNNLWLHEEGAVIELLDRPKPKIELPTGEGAVIEYKRINTDAFRPLRRIATFSGGVWRVVGEAPMHGAGLHTTVPHEVTPEYMASLLGDDFRRTDFKVRFEGVAK